MYIKLEIKETVMFIKCKQQKSDTEEVSRDVPD
jgi:hypothetical protein